MRRPGPTSYRWYLNYTYLYQANQEGSETLNYQYKTINQTISIPITITPEVQIAVPDVEPENLNAGIEGYVNYDCRRMSGLTTARTR